MLSKTDIAKLYDAVLSTPGMNETVKLDLRIPRKNVLLLSKVIDRGLSKKEGDEKEVSVLDIVSKETMEELGRLSGEILQKAGLTDMNEKLNAF
jgi:hypothetical protein